ncbi:TonB-dependent receptor [Pseudoxanthomonas jiangsuensis]|uniref:TonB-dependent receptor plug domain-containing protein n=1 Tax=Pseudoxanthomonas jiangsuensis TaxID=619688 RepID=UPI00139082BE|nr:TonB-dependent receptor [Pseudoxanthomonas jiangsuensis]KAF1698495.1 TonB-dependent receptor [Pseudoxanthomonas jiangsuensis]
MQSFHRDPRRIRRSLLAKTTVLALAAAAPVAFAADDAAAGGDDVSNLDTVLVTGSRASNRTIANSAVPVDVVSGNDLVGTGKSNLLDALQSLLPSFSQQARQSDVEGNIPGAQLRNLSPGYTLVLVNGKRRNASAYASIGTSPGQSWTDLSLIPTSAIERVEVLRDGASAIYGSDAIAGVFNLILKSSPSEGSVSLEAGTSYEGDGDRVILTANKGFALGERGFINLSAEHTDQDYAVRSLEYRDTYLSYPAINASGNPVRLGSNNSQPAGATPNPKEATRNRYAQNNQGVAEYTTSALAANWSLGLGADTDFYGFATYTARESAQLQNHRLPATIFASNPGLLEVYPDGFTPTIDTDEVDYSVVGGFKGVLGGWDWDASATYNRDYFDLYTRNSANFSLVYPGAKTDFFAGRLDYDQWIGNLDLKRAAESSLLASPLDLSLGLEYQHESYQRDAGEPDSYYGSGAVAYPGNAPGDVAESSRHRVAAYAGVAANLTERWYLDLAARYEDHSDFGDVSTGRLTTRFDFNDHFAVRGTVSNGFHAPGLAAQNLQITKVTPTTSELTARVGSAVAVALGATPLQPEQADNYSVGVVFSPTRSFHAALDLFQIDISDQLGRSSNIGYNAANPNAVVDASNTVLTAAQKQIVDDLLATAGVTIPAGGSYFVNYYSNVGDTRTRGVEFTLEASHALSWGNLRWNYGFNRNLTEFTRVADIPSVLQGLPNITLLSEGGQYDVRYRVPDYQHVAGAYWSQGGWRANVNFVYHGPTRRLSGTYRWEIDPVLVTNIGGGYQFANGWAVDAGVNNLTDEYPSTVPEQALSASSNAVYTWQYASGSLNRLGGYYYARVSYRL